MTSKKGGLGRGLDSLFSENAQDNRSVSEISINDIEPNRNQPRKEFDEEKISALSESIKLHGIIQPIAVKPNLNGTYTIIAGERRWRAALKAELKTVPVVILDIDDENASFLTMVENLQREDLNPYEEANGYKTMMDKFGLTQEKIAENVGKSRTVIANFLRVLKLPEKMLISLKDGEISFSQARTLLAAQSEEIREKMYAAAKNGASVRVLENMAKMTPKTGKKTVKNNFYTEVELSLKDELKRKVKIKPTGKGKGTISFEFFSDEDLSFFAKKLAK